MHSDRCCEGSYDVRDNILCSLFPGLERCPYWDQFHKVPSPERGLVCACVCD